MPAYVKFSSDFILGIMWHLESSWLIHFIIVKQQLNIPGHSIVGPHLDMRQLWIRESSYPPRVFHNTCGNCLCLCLLPQSLYVLIGNDGAVKS